MRGNKEMYEKYEDTKEDFGRKENIIKNIYLTSTIDKRCGYR